MGLDDEDLVIRDASTGGVFMKFRSKEVRDGFLDSLKRVLDKHDLDREEGHTCGDCAAFPCFRAYGEDYPSGLCFQQVRLCRQECKNYNYDSVPADGGICKIDSQGVNYCDECHIEEFRRSRL